MALSLNPVTAAIQPYLLWIKLGFFALCVASVFWAGWKVCDWRWEGKENRELKDLQAQMEKDREAWEEEKRRWDLASQITSTQIQNLEAQKDTLLATITGLKLTRTIKVEPNAQGECESAALGDAFRLRWNGVVETAGSLAAGDGS